MKTYDLDGIKLPKENTDYELIPSEGENWDIRILTGEFNETVLQYGQLVVSEDGEHMRFNFDIVSTPDPELKDENIALQRYAAMLLSSILESAATALEEKEKDDKR